MNPADTLTSEIRRSIPDIDNTATTVSLQPRSQIDNHLAAAARLVAMLLGSAITGPALLFEPNYQLRYTTSSVFAPKVRRRRRRISLAEARRLALQAFAEARRELEQERAAEARFLISAWDDELS